MIWASKGDLEKPKVRIFHKCKISISHEVSSMLNNESKAPVIPFNRKIVLLQIFVELQNTKRVLPLAFLNHYHHFILAACTCHRALTSYNFVYFVQVSSASRAERI